MVMPGCVRPSSGPMTWTMPWVSLPKAWIGMPNSAQFVSSCRIWAAACMSTMGRPRGVVGVPWSAVATVLSGRRTCAPRARSPVKAWGLVTSWTRWRSMARTAGAPGSCETTWSSQIFSTRVRGWVMAAAALLRWVGVGRVPALSARTPSASSCAQHGRLVDRQSLWDGRLGARLGLRVHGLHDRGRRIASRPSRPATTRSPVPPSIAARAETGRSGRGVQGEGRLAAGSVSATLEGHLPEAIRLRLPSRTAHTSAGPGHGDVPASAASASSGWAG